MRQTVEQSHLDNNRPSGTTRPVHYSRPRACQPCRNAKVKCDMLRPECKVCLRHDRSCTYDEGHSRARPSRAIIESLQKEKKMVEDKFSQLERRNSQLEQLLLEKGNTSHHVENVESISLINSDNNDGGRQEISDNHHNIYGQHNQLSPLDINRQFETSQEAETENRNDEDNQHRDDLDDRVMVEDDMSQVASEPVQFLSLDEQGHVRAIGPTSALYSPITLRHTLDNSLNHMRNELIANAAIQRQLESRIPATIIEIDGTPIELAMHLLNIHWNRQHHSFLLVYRPAFTRDMVCNGPYFSKFLANAIFASASKFSDRSEIREDPDNPRTAGLRFLRRSEQLLKDNSPFENSSIPTAAGLLLLGSTFIARGEVSKAWKYVGLAIRMVYDLGLHLDCRDPELSSEDIEIRRRLFWGAFIVDKVQALYLGRPVAIHWRDTCVPLELTDTFEEHDPWLPYPLHTATTSPQSILPTSIYSVSTFKHLCLLSQIMTRIIQRFYLPRSNLNDAELDLQALDQSLSNWHSNLPAFLKFEPWIGDTVPNVSPNIIVLNTTFHSLRVLLHRPFISKEQYNQASDVSAASWNSCISAAKKITNIMTSYRSTYTLRGAPYLVGYASYVACTIHVRNITTDDNQPSLPWSSRWMLNETLSMLDELMVPNPCLRHAATIIRKLMGSNDIQDRPQNLPTLPSGQPLTTLSSNYWSGANGNPLDAPNPKRLPIQNDFRTNPVNISVNDSLFGFLNDFDPDDSFVWEWSNHMMTDL